MSSSMASLPGLLIQPNPCQPILTRIPWILMRKFSQKQMYHSWIGICSGLGMNSLDYDDGILA